MTASIKGDETTFYHMQPHRLIEPRIHGELPKLGIAPSEPIGKRAGEWVVSLVDPQDVHG